MKNCSLANVLILLRGHWSDRISAFLHIDNKFVKLGIDVLSLYQDASRQAICIKLLSKQLRKFLKRLQPLFSNNFSVWSKICNSFTILISATAVVSAIRNEFFSFLLSVCNQHFAKCYFQFAINISLNVVNASLIRFLFWDSQYTFCCNFVMPKMYSRFLIWF